jgi:hypothetical protein
MLRYQPLVVLLFLLFALLNSCQKKQPAGQSGVRASESRHCNDVFMPRLPFVRSPMHKSVAFHYTDDEEAFRKPAAYIARKLERARSGNEKMKSPGDMSVDAIAGYGLYWSGDPVSARTYGDFLIIAPLRSNSLCKI